MRVLDVGCGTGSVSLLAAEVVGPQGQVVGVDREAAAVEGAQERALNAGLDHVSFVEGSMASPPSGPFDAVVGRFVLMHQEDPAEALGPTLVQLRTGGVVAFVESTMDVLLGGPHSFPTSPLYDAVVRWKYQVVTASGADDHAGLRLRDTLVRAGLADVGTRLTAELSGADDDRFFQYMEESVRSLTPKGVELGVGTFRQGGFLDLAARLQEEARALGAVYVHWPVVGGWARKP